MIFMIYYLRNTDSDPAFNLAMEEHLLKNTTDEYFIVGINDKSVIIGKHQNAVAEINSGYLFENNIPVFRRISGGGSVYHDPGNINFTFIVNGEEGKMVSFRKYTLPLIEVLQKNGIEANFEEHNNLTINGLKISGNAEHIYKNRLLHHGTLLYNSDLNRLKEAIKPGTGVYIDKSVKSIRSKVTNISEHLINHVDIRDFASMIIQHIRETFPGAAQYHLSGYDIEKISELKQLKYDSWGWNFGYSPPYVFKNSMEVSGVTISVYLSVKDGIINDFEISGGDFSSDVINDVKLSLIGQRHDFAEIFASLNARNIELSPEVLSTENLLKLIF